MSSDDEGSHPGMAVDHEEVYEEEFDENEPLGGEELREIRDDALNLVRSIEREHERDLSRHLYAIYLNREKRARQGLRIFPHARYTQWPVSTLRNEVNDPTIPKNLDLSRDIHKVIPPFAEMYTRVDEPRQEIYYGQCAPGDPVHDRTYDDFDEAKGLLMAETSAIFERKINKRISSDKRFVPPLSQEVNSSDESKQQDEQQFDFPPEPEGYYRLEPIIELDSPMPMQSRMRVMKLVNRILDNVAHRELDPVKRVMRVRDWKDIIRNDIRVGNTLARCKELFLKDVPTDKRKIQLSLSDARVFNHMEQIERPLPGNQKSKSQLLATSVLKPTAPVMGTEELLDEMLIHRLPDRHEYNYVSKKLLKARKRAGQRRRTIATLLKKQRLEVIDKRLFSQARKRGYCNGPTQLHDDEFYTPVKNSKS